MKLKSTWIPFILSFIVVLGLKIYQFVTIGDAAVRKQWGNIELIAFIVAIVAAFIMVLVSWLSKDSPKVFVLSKDFFTGMISILTGLMTTWCSVNELIIYLSYKRELIYLFLAIIGILAGVVFVIFGICFIKGKDFFQKYRLLTLLPTAWVLIRILNLFFAYNSIPTDLSHVITSLAEIFLVYFLFYQARLFSGLFKQNTFKRVFCFGFSAVLFITLYTTHDLFNIIDTGRKISISSLAYIITDLIIAFYILCFISGLKVGKNLESLSEVLDEPEKNEEPVREIKDNIEPEKNEEPVREIKDDIEPEKNEEPVREIKDDIEHEEDENPAKEIKYDVQTEDDEEMKKVNELIENIKMETQKQEEI